MYQKMRITRESGECEMNKNAFNSALLKSQENGLGTVKLLFRLNSHTQFPITTFTTLLLRTSSLNFESSSNSFPQVKDFFSLPFLKVFFLLQILLKMRFLLQLLVDLDEPQQIKIWLLSLVLVFLRVWPRPDLGLDLRGRPVPLPQRAERVRQRKLGQLDLPSEDKELKLIFPFNMFSLLKICHIK